MLAPGQGSALTLQRTFAEADVAPVEASVQTQTKASNTPMKR
jgi:hypothetical protein